MFIGRVGGKLNVKSGLTRLKSGLTGAGPDGRASAQHGHAKGRVTVPPTETQYGGRPRVLAIAMRLP
jgi:hypothetical protein